MVYCRQLRKQRQGRKAKAGIGKVNATKTAGHGRAKYRNKIGTGNRVLKILTQNNGLPAKEVSTAPQEGLL